MANMSSNSAGNDVDSDVVAWGHWSDADEQTFDGQCDHCDKHRPVQVAADPFQEEINGVIEESVWCHPCYIECARDI